MVPEGRARMLPEDLSTKTFVIYTKADLSQDTNWIENKLSHLASAKLKYSRPNFPKSIPQGEPVYLVSAIGKPNNFEALMSTQYVIKKHFIFPDHHHYTEKNIVEIRSHVGSLPILTTQKDFVKLQKWKDSLKLYEVSVDFEFVENEHLFHEVLKRSVLS
jgi:tetraacyldisaccharide-1-P 4'-kinase